ncbi:MAG TPA: 3-dehydroquinate synthase [Thermogutta sp.]|nr:3-dehydroquinate synthase [Thermogutta sp.]
MDESGVATVKVNLGERSYPIHIGNNLLAKRTSLLAGLDRVSHAVIITDSNVGPLYLDQVSEIFQEAGVRTDSYVVPAGEKSKGLASAESIWNWMLDVKADRGSFVVALGGGVVGDLAGFAAATFARGVRLLQIPTSLLAQVDSSVGGKVGVNLPKAKNMVGAFYQPCAVWIDVSTLRTLPQREYLSGLAEVVKYGVILDSNFFSFLEEHVDDLLAQDPAVLVSVVKTCCQLKATIVEQDEREVTGLRAVLNYGHTFAHAIETLTGYNQWLHGEAVAIGMACAAELAVRLGMFPEELAQRQESLLSSLHLPIRIRGLAADKILECMMRDKKVQHGHLRFVLPTTIGRVVLVPDVSRQQVESVIDEMQDLSL